MPNGRYELSWIPSAAPVDEIDKVEVIVTIDGVATTQIVAPGTDRLEAVFAANTSIQFAVKTYNKQGLTSTSVSFSFTVPSFVAPPPATDLNATLLEVIPDSVPIPVMGAAKKTPAKAV